MDVVAAFTLVFLCGIAIGAVTMYWLLTECE